MQRTIFCFLLALGCALGREGQQCCSSCKSITDCGPCAKEGEECRIASGLCSDHITDSNVDCSLKTAEGKPCCVFSKLSDGCECVQQRCHLHEFPSARVPSECQGRNMAGPPIWVFGCGLVFVVIFSIAVTVLVKRRRRNILQQQQRHEEEGSGVAAQELGDPSEKDPGGEPLLEESEKKAA